MIKKNLHWALILGGIAVLATVLGILPHNAEATRAPALDALTESNDSAVTPSLESVNASIEKTIPVIIEAEPEIIPGDWHEATVKSGDSLSRIFNRHGLSAQELYRVTSDKTSATYLKKIFPGDTIKLRIDENRLTELVYPYEINKSLHIVRNEDQFSAELIEIPLETRITHASATINDSLFLSAQAAGMSDATTMELAGIFGWDVDFALDIRQGDSFTALYEEVYLNGEKVRDGKIIAAEFINQGESYKAVRYTSPDQRTDYYTPDGKSMRKAFLRTPVSFSRISSRFDLRRKHPVLNRIRAHKGVDYAAATGTPIKATGDGKIVHRGVKGGYGHTVIIQHGNTYSTLYAHMSSYKRGLKVGSRVKQGQVVGFVGSSGLATGPHLHYELRVNGVHRNPLTVKLPSAEPLPKQFMTDFQQHSQQLLAQIDNMKPTSLALADTQ